MAFRGRHWIAVWLLAFLTAAWIVIARQTSAIRMARSLAAVRDTATALEGKRAELDRRIRTAESRAVLVRRAREQLGMHLPADTEIILFPVPSRAH